MQTVSCQVFIEEHLTGAVTKPAGTWGRQLNQPPLKGIDGLHGLGTSEQDRARRHRVLIGVGVFCN